MSGANGQGRLQDGPSVIWGTQTSLQAQANAEALERAIARQYAENVLAAEDLALVRGERIKRTAEEFTALPESPQLIEEVLAAEVNLLGGPPGSGKSLLALDWAFHIAAGVPWRGHAVPEKRSVLWVASEGLHDARTRWHAHPLWEQAKRNFWVLDIPISLTVETDVDWLIEEYLLERPGLVVFDVIYGMGMRSDNGTEDALPVLKAMKRISAKFDAATLALGHPGHNGERRFRGSSMWRDLAYTDWQMRDGLLTCEKSKIANAAALRDNYAVEFPAIRWLTRQEAHTQEEMRSILIAVDIEEHPGDSISARAVRLAPALGVGKDRARVLIREAVPSAK